MQNSVGTFRGDKGTRHGQILVDENLDAPAGRDVVGLQVVLDNVLYIARAQQEALAFFNETAERRQRFAAVGPFT